MCAYTAAIVDEYLRTPLIRVVQQAPSGYVVSNSVLGVSGTGAFSNTSSTYQRANMYTTTLCSAAAESNHGVNQLLCPAARTTMVNLANEKFMCEFPVSSGVEMASGPSTAFACSSEEELAQSTVQVRPLCEEHAIAGELQCDVDPLRNAILFISPCVYTDRFLWTKVPL